MLHLLSLERIAQHREVPFLAPVIETLKQLGRYSDAGLMAAVMFMLRDRRDIRNILRAWNGGR